jgi:hypothetical protein
MPKILMTGKPLYVDGERRICRIEGGGTVNDIVADPDHNYIAAIGGDIHNYQRYPIDAGNGRTLMCLVSGGGGAFMHGTHTIPKVDPQQIGVAEEDFRCYPLRGDSLSRFSELYAKKLLGRLLFRATWIPADEASAVVGDELGITPTRETAQNLYVSQEMRETARRLMDRLPDRERGALHVPFAEWLDANEPPLFKHFLKIDANPDSVRIRCFGVTGCEDEDGAERPPEDDIRAERQADGTWRWSWPT